MYFASAGFTSGQGTCQLGKQMWTSCHAGTVEREALAGLQSLISDCTQVDPELRPNVRQVLERIKSIIRIYEVHRTAAVPANEVNGTAPGTGAPTAAAGGASAAGAGGAAAGVGSAAWTAGVGAGGGDRGAGAAATLAASDTGNSAALGVSTPAAHSPNVGGMHEHQQQCSSPEVAVIEADLVSLLPAVPAFSSSAVRGVSSLRRRSGPVSVGGSAALAPADFGIPESAPAAGPTLVPEEGKAWKTFSIGWAGGVSASKGGSSSGDDCTSKGSTRMSSNGGGGGALGFLANLPTWGRGSRGPSSGGDTSKPGSSSGGSSKRSSSGGGAVTVGPARITPAPAAGASPPKPFAEGPLAAGVQAVGGEQLEVRSVNAATGGASTAAAGHHGAGGAQDSPNMGTNILGLSEDGSSSSKEAGVGTQCSLSPPPLRTVASDGIIQLQQAASLSGSGLHYRGASSAPGAHPAAGLPSSGTLSGVAAKLVSSPKPGRGRRQVATAIGSGSAVPKG